MNLWVVLTDTKSPCCGSAASWSGRVLGGAVNRDGSAQGVLKRSSEVWGCYAGAVWVPGRQCRGLRSCGTAPQSDVAQTLEEGRETRR